MRPTDHARRILRRAQLALAGLALLAALELGGSVEDRLLVVAATTDRTPATAELLEPAMPPPSPAVIPVTSSLVRWTAEDGTSRTGYAPVLAGTEAGAEVPVWVDPSGAVGPPPPTPGDAAIAGVATGIGGVLIAWLAILLAGTGCRSLLAARDSEDWARGWARVEPVWSGRRR